MDKTFDFNQVPYDWTLCYVERCSHKDECMRYQVCLIAPDSMTRNKCVLPTVLKKRECPHFMPIKKVRAAIGFQHIFDEIKAKHSHVMRMKLANYLGTGGSYYRYRNGENLLMPEQQEWIKKMFRDFGYTEEVVFDDYKDVYRFCK